MKAPAIILSCIVLRFAPHVMQSPEMAGIARTLCEDMVGALLTYLIFELYNKRDERIRAAISLLFVLLVSSFVANSILFSFGLNTFAYSMFLALSLILSAGVIPTIMQRSKIRNSSPKPDDPYIYIVMRRPDTILQAAYSSFLAPATSCSLLIKGKWYRWSRQDSKLHVNNSGLINRDKFIIVRTSRKADHFAVDYLEGLFKERKSYNIITFNFCSAFFPVFGMRFRFYHTMPTFFINRITRDA